MSQQSKQQILLLDPHELRRASVAKLLGIWAAQNNANIVDKSPAEMHRLFDEDCQWRLILFSCGAQSLKNRELIQELRVLKVLGKGTPLIVISDLGAGGEIIAALELGLDGYLPTNIAPELALKACTFVIDGGSFFPALRSPSGDDRQGPPDEEPPSREGPTLRQQGRAGDASSSNGAHACHTDELKSNTPSMTCRQQDVLELLCEGQSNKLIARNLNMTEATVKVHVRQIMRKLGADNRTQAALLAREQETCFEQASQHALKSSIVANGQLQQVAE